MRISPRLKPLERLDALARHLDVRLDLAEPFARRIERDRRLVDQRVQIGEQPLGVRHTIGDDDEKARRQSARERGDERRVGRAGKAGGAQLARGAGSVLITRANAGRRSIASSRLGRGT